MDVKGEAPSVTPLAFGLVAYVKIGPARIEAPAQSNLNAGLLCKCKRILSTNDTLLHRMGRLKQEIYYFCSHCGAYYNPVTGKKMCSSW